VWLLDIQFTGANFPINEAGVASSSRGLVGDTIFAVLPNIKPVHTFLITIAVQSVSSLTLPFFSALTDGPVPRSG
jgi:alpha-1,3-glucosyltransferase